MGRPQLTSTALLRVLDNLGPHNHIHRKGKEVLEPLDKSLQGYTGSCQRRQVGAIRQSARRS